MITRMTVDCFKAIRHVEVDLAPFTVLIGPNDTGKTSFLEAVYALAESTRNSLAECFWSPWQNRELVHNGTPDTPVRFTAELGSLGDHGGHALALKEHGRDNEVAKMKETGFGPRYEVEGELTAPDGQRPRVRTVWQVDVAEIAPLLITARPVEAKS
jgi:predicted ATPase